MIVPIVEGHAEQQSLPLLIRRILNDHGIYDLPIRRGLRVPRSKIVKEGELERYIRYARQQPDATAVVVVIDADDDCPRELGPELLTRSRSEAAGCRVSVVLARIELEAWFLAGIESLRENRGIRNDATAPLDPETIGDAKGWLSDNMSAGRTYIPVDDQPALAMRFDYRTAATRSRSLRKFLKDISEIGQAL